MNLVIYDEVKFYNKYKNQVIDAYSHKEKLHCIFTVLLAATYIYGKIGNKQSVCVATFILLSAIAVFSSVSQLSYMFFFFSPMYLYVVFGTIPFYNVIIFMILIKRVIFKRIKIAVIPIIGLMILLGLEFFALMGNGSYPTFNMVKLFIIMFMMIIHLYNTPNGYSNTKAIQYLIFGTVVFALAFILVNFKTIISNSYRSGGLGELDPNTYGLYNLFVLTIILQQLLVGRINNRKSIAYAIFAFVIFVAGFMTLSKTYVIMSLFTIITFMITTKKSIKTTIIICLSIVVGCFILMQIPFFIEVYNNLICRFEMAGSVSELTTGRSDTIQMYSLYLKDNAKALFWGEGLYSYFNKFGIRPHNSSLELIISWGIIGTSVFIYVFKKGIKVYRNKIEYMGKIKIVNAMPLTILIIYMQSLTLMYQEATYAYIVMAIMLLFPQNNNYIRKKRTRG